VHVRTVWGISTELHNPTVYEGGISDVSLFLSTFEDTVVEEQRIPA